MFLDVAVFVRVYLCIEFVGLCCCLSVGIVLHAKRRRRR